MCIFCGKENDRKLCNIEINGIEFVKIVACIFREIFAQLRNSNPHKIVISTLLLKLARTVILLEIRVGPYWSSRYLSLVNSLFTSLFTIIYLVEIWASVHI